MRRPTSPELREKADRYARRMVLHAWTVWLFPLLPLAFRLTGRWDRLTRTRGARRAGRRRLRRRDGAVVASVRRPPAARWPRGAPAAGPDRELPPARTATSSLVHRAAASCGSWLPRSALGAVVGLAMVLTDRLAVVNGAASRFRPSSTGDAAIDRERRRVPGRRAAPGGGRSGRDPAPLAVSRSSAVGRSRRRADHARRPRGRSAGSGQILHRIRIAVREHVDPGPRRRTQGPTDTPMSGVAASTLLNLDERAPPGALGGTGPRPVAGDGAADGLAVVSDRRPLATPRCGRRPLAGGPARASGRTYRDLEAVGPAGTGVSSWSVRGSSWRRCSSVALLTG